jgi:predicted Zn-dependent protease
LVQRLQLTEISDASQANIETGWGDFNTASSGVLGYTNYTTDGNGTFTHAEIRMEDPTETTLVTDQNGQEAYSGTNAELYQVALHEIGHALGLADNSDPNSVMYYGSGASNVTLDATDISNIRSLYSQPAASMSETSATASPIANDATLLVAPLTSAQQPLQHAA